MEDSVSCWKVFSFVGSFQRDWLSSYIALISYLEARVLLEVRVFLVLQEG